MKKILFANRYSLIDKIVESLAAENKVTVLDLEISRLPFLDKVKIIKIKFVTLGINHLVDKIQISLPLYIKGLKQILQAEKPDIIVVFDFYHWYFWQALAYVRENPEVKIYLFSESKRLPRNPLSRFIFKLFLKWLQKNIKTVSKVMAFTNDGRSFLQDNLPDTAVEVLPVPVDTTLFRPTTDKKIKTDQTLNIIMNARFVAYKRHQDLLEALVQIKRDGRDFRLTLISRDQTGREGIELLVEKFDLKKEVVFISALPPTELVSLYQKNDILVLPSYNEAIGMVVPEAMACGLPTITSDTAGANVYVEDSKTGFIFETGNVEELTEKIKLCYNFENLAEMGRNASLRIKSNFSEEVVKKKFIELF